MRDFGPFDEKHDQSMRHLLRRRRPHPLADVFDAKRANDIARTEALQAVADWSAGRLSCDEAEQKVRAWQTNIDSLVASVREHDADVATLSVAD